MISKEVLFSSKRYKNSLNIMIFHRVILYRILFSTLMGASCKHLVSRLVYISLNDILRLIPITFKKCEGSSMNLPNYSPVDVAPIRTTTMDACLATISNQPYFQPVKLTYFESLYEYNSNFLSPILEWITKAHNLDQDANIACILTIGAIKVYPDGSIEDRRSELEYYGDLAIQKGEMIEATRMEELHHMNIYHEFRSFSSGTLDVGDEDIFSKIRHDTSVYLSEPEISSRLHYCVLSMDRRLHYSTPRQLCKLRPMVNYLLV
jgi:hypothetical protein